MMKRNWSNNFHRDIRQNLNGDYSLNVRNVWDIQFEKYIYTFQKCIRYEGMGKETGLLLLLRVDYITHRIRGTHVARNYWASCGAPLRAVLVRARIRIHNRVPWPSRRSHRRNGAV